MNAIQQIEQALAAGPTEGNWHWHEDENMYPSPRDWRADLYPEAIIQTDGGHYGPDAATRAYLVAVQPANIRELLSEIHSLRASLKR